MIVTLDVSDDLLLIISRLSLQLVNGLFFRPPLPCLTAFDAPARMEHVRFSVQNKTNNCNFNKEKIKV